MSDRSARRAALIFLAIDKIMLACANTALVVVLLTICWNVLSRYVLRAPVAWAGDITTVGFAWFIFTAMVAVHNRRQHIGVDVFGRWLSPSASMWFRRAVDVFVALFCAYTAYLCTLQMIASQGTAWTTVLRIPLSFMFASLVLGFSLMALRSVGYVFGVGPQQTDNSKTGEP